MKLSLPGLTEDMDHIIQLVDEQGKVIREGLYRNPGTIEYNYLAPRKYRVKLIYDRERNGKWDSGNYLKKVQPEKVIYNEEMINIRSNWDAELEWKVEESF